MRGVAVQTNNLPSGRRPLVPQLDHSARPAPDIDRSPARTQANPVKQGAALGPKLVSLPTQPGAFPAATSQRIDRVWVLATRLLRRLCGERLRQVVLFGSWVRGEDHEESDVDLIVVTAEIGYRARERDRLVDVLYDLELHSRRTIQASRVAEADALSGNAAFVAEALPDGAPVLGSSGYAMDGGSFIPS